MADDVLAMSESCPLVEWKTRFKNYHPQFTGAEDEDSTWLPLVDGYCSFVQDRWVYVMLSRLALDDAMVAFEIYVDEDGNTFFADRNDQVTPLSPIPKRSAPVNMAGASGPTVRFPVVDEYGQALDVRLLYSRFRLPSKTLKKLLRKQHRHALYDSVAPLWEWRYGYEDRSPLHSKDGFSLVETPLWMGNPGEEQRVWAGTDPFTVVENSSNAYVQACNRYRDKFEPTSEPRKKEVLRLMLGRSIHASILKNEAANAKYGGAIRAKDLAHEIAKDDQLRSRLIKRLEERGASLCKVLDSRLFELFQKASIDLEGIDPGERSEPMVEHLRILAVATRLLSECKSGRALHASWAREAAKDPSHFLNKVVFPNEDPVASHFKAFRWSSKAVAALLAETISHRYRAWPLRIREQLADEIRGFLRLGVGNAFDPKTGIIDFQLADDLVTHASINMKSFSVKVVSGDLLKPREIKFAAVDPTMDALFEDWVAAGQLKTTGFNKKFLDAKFLGGMLLDIINLAAALDAIGDAEGGDAARDAMFGAGAAGLSLFVNVGEQAFKMGLEKKLNPIRAGQLFLGLKLFVGIYYARSNYAAGEKAFESGDADRGFALDIASAAEIAGVGAHLWVLAAPGSLVAPWIIPIAGAVAAGAYIAANYLKDDPLEQFLRNCEWGVAPYADNEQHWSWAEKSVLEWKKDYLTQADTLFRLLVRLEAWWNFKNWPAVTIGWQLSQPATVVHVEYMTRFKNGTEHVTDKFTFEGRSLPSSPPYEVTTTPKAGYTGPSIDLVTVRVTLAVDRGVEPETLDCVLMEDGVGIWSKKVTRVPSP